MIEWSPKAFDVKTCLNVATFECVSFFHWSTKPIHLVLTYNNDKNEVSCLKLTK